MARGEVAIVTGSTSGIGLGLAEGFASAGYRLAINGFAGLGEPEALVDRLHSRYSIDVFYHPADLADPRQCEALVRDTESRFGCVDVLVNNAGIQHVAPIESFPLEQWDKILAVNLSAAFHTMRAALPGMQRRGVGRIINIASVHGMVGSIHKAAYVAAKHGIVGLTRVAALENAGRGITCNAICPGFVVTPLLEKQIEVHASAKGISAEQAAREFLSEKQPSGRFTTVEEIAALALFLCSSAAANLTGACLPIDGSWTAQ